MIEVGRGMNRGEKEEGRRGSGDEERRGGSDDGSDRSNEACWQAASAGGVALRLSGLRFRIGPL